MGLANRLVPRGEALAAALELAARSRRGRRRRCAATGCPPTSSGRCRSTDALSNEYDHGMSTLATGEAFGGLSSTSPASGVPRAGATSTDSRRQSRRAMPRRCLEI